LPSKDELNKLYEKKAVVGGFAADYYWSSSQVAALNAWFQYFVCGFQFFDFQVQLLPRSACQGFLAIHPFTYSSLCSLVCQFFRWPPAGRPRILS
jgi:hypothetical protein